MIRSNDKQGMKIVLIEIEPNIYCINNESKNKNIHRRATNLKNNVKTE